MSAGLRVRVLNFQTCYEIPVGFIVVPVPAPAGTNPNPNSRPAGRVSAGTRVFYIHCHLYSPIPIPPPAQQPASTPVNHLPALTDLDAHQTRIPATITPWASLMPSRPHSPACPVSLQHCCRISKGRRRCRRREQRLPWLLVQGSVQIINSRKHKKMSHQMF